MTTLLQHVLPPLLPSLPITSSLSFHYTIDSLILSSTAGNLTDALFLSVRSALSDLRVPRTRNVAYEATQTATGDDILVEEKSAMAGIKGAAQGGKKSKQRVERGGGKAVALGAEFEVEDYWDEGDMLEEKVRDALPVCVTLNVVSSGGGAAYALS